MKIESFNPVVPVQIEIDGIVPIIIRFAGNSDYPHNFWRTGDFKYSLVEIAVDQTTGGIGRIVLLLLKNVSYTSQLTINVDGQNCRGIPNASITEWNSDQTTIDVEGKMRGSLTGRTFTVFFFGDKQESYNLVKCDRVTFLLNSSKTLCGFQVNDLTDQEIEDLLYTITPRSTTLSG